MSAVTPVPVGERPVVDGERLRRRLDAMAEVGSTGDGGVCRLALTDADREARDLLCTWMAELGMRVEVDAVGNVVGTWPAARFDPPVLLGSHIDSVATGGRLDGTLGVLAGLEVVEALAASGVEPEHPVAVAAFTDEEGSRFAPDMLGSLVHVGGLDLEVALDTVAVDGARLGDELARIGYAGPKPCPGTPPHAFVELHIEQGPVLDAADEVIGAVTGVQGISWQELTVRGQSNHAGTTPMGLRRDPMVVVAGIALTARRLALELGPPTVATVGRVDVHPGLVNVVPAGVTCTVDLRHTDAATLLAAERKLAAEVARLADAEGCDVERRVLARFDPVAFPEPMVELVEAAAQRRGHPVRRLPSGAGHDAQMLARVCPTAMVFVPSVDGISHNPAERTRSAHLTAGLEVLADVVWQLAGVGQPALTLDGTALAPAGAFDPMGER